MATPDTNSITYTTSVLKGVKFESLNWIETLFKGFRNDLYSGLRSETLNFHIRYCYNHGLLGHFFCTKTVERAIHAHKCGLRTMLTEYYLAACRRYHEHLAADHEWARSATPLIFFPLSMPKEHLELLMIDLREIFDLFPYFDPNFAECEELDLINFINLNKDFSAQNRKLRQANLDVLVYKILTPRRLELEHS